MRLPEEPDETPQINIVPMIDIIFVVLIFFILSSLLLTRSQGLPVSLPSASTAETQVDAQHTLRVTLTAEGSLQLGNNPTTLDDLPSQIQARRIGDRPILIVIQADRTVTHGAVVQLMDVLRQVPNIQIGIATDPTSGNSRP